MKISLELEQIQKIAFSQTSSLAKKIAKKMAHRLDQPDTSLFEREVSLVVENEIQKAIKQIALFCEWGVFFQISNEHGALGFTRKILEKCHLMENEKKIPLNYWIYLRLSPHHRIPTFLIIEESNDQVIQTTYTNYQK